MNKRKKYHNEEVQEDLYQYEMGIELGAELEEAKNTHLKEYEKQPCRQDQMNRLEYQKPYNKK